MTSKPGTFYLDDNACRAGGQGLYDLQQKQADKLLQHL